MEPAFREARRILHLAVPVIVAQVGLMMLGVIDNLMLGHFSVEALGASALGRIWVIGTLLIGMGFVLGIDPIVSQAHGAGDGPRTALALERGLVITLLCSVPIAIAWLFTEDVLLWMRQDPELARQAHTYVLVQIPGIPAWLGFTALRSYTQGRGYVRPAMLVAVLANGLNAFGNWVLIFGNLGAPRLGVVGAGISTMVTEIAMALALWAIIARWDLHRVAWRGWSRAAFDYAGLRQVLGQGAPVAMMLGLEIWAFQIASLWAGWLGRPELAAHTIVLNLASLSFMVPLGISMGTAIRVGNLIGAGDSNEAQHTAWVGLGLGAGAMSLFGLVFLFGRELLPSLYTLDLDVRRLAAGILPIAAAFQLFDGTQVVGAGVLRGMGRPRPAAVFNLLGYYAFALPFGYWLAFSQGFGLAGIWWGLSLGLFSVAALFVAWILRRGPRHVHALEALSGVPTPEVGPAEAAAPEPPRA